MYGRLLRRPVSRRGREVLIRFGIGVSEARRSLAVRRGAAELRDLWAEPSTRSAVLNGIPVRRASADFGADSGDWGTTATVRLELYVPMPRAAAQLLAGKAVRRLKALAETGEIPTTEANPSFRPVGGDATG